MKPSQNCLDLVKSSEGFFAKAYRCPAGVWTIGYGTTVYPNGDKVKQGDTCTPEQADAWMMHELDEAARVIDREAKVGLSQNQVDALASFVYNCGQTAFCRSTLLALLNKGDFKGAADQFLKWVNGGGRQLPGLVRRRKAERELFLKG